MPISIGSNIPSLQADRSLSQRSDALRANFEKLASGKRINRGADDPAGLAVALSLLSEADTHAVGSRNISDGVSAANIAEGALNSASQITTRLGELSAQAANGTLSDSQRGALNQEYQSLKSELDRISQTTEFNGQQLLDGSFDVSIQAGTGSDPNSQVSLPLPNVSSSGLGLSADISTQANAQQALDNSKSALQSLATSRAEIGSAVGRLDVARENNLTSEINERAASSRILDLDVAQEAAALTANRIGQQVSVAIKAQANLLPQAVLRLLS